MFWVKFLCFSKEKVNFEKYLMDIKLENNFKSKKEEAFFLLKKG